MSDIKAGDLVMVVKPKPCCGRTGAIGRTYTVSLIETCEAGCGACGKSLRITMVSGLNHDEGFCITQLKKIPPLTEPESILEQDSIPV